MQTAELIDNAGFYPPVEHTQIGMMLSEFEYKKNKINDFSNEIINSMNEVSSYFGRFYAKQNSNNHPPSLTYLLEKEGAVKALEAEYWNKVILLTGVMDVMPEIRRNELRNQISRLETIEFNRDNIRSTVTDLLLSRELYFAERVDGVFKALSGKIVEASDICAWTIGNDYEFRVHEQHPDKYGIIHYYHVKPSNGAIAVEYCLCDNKDFALKIAKMLNEDLKRGDV